MTKQEIINNFNPNDPGLSDASLFGLPFGAEHSEIIVIPVPWEVTVSYGAGASEGVDAVFDASFQVDLAHQEFPELWKLGIYMDEEIPNWKERSDKFKAQARSLLDNFQQRRILEPTLGQRSIGFIGGCQFLDYFHFRFGVGEHIHKIINQGNKLVAFH